MEDYRFYLIGNDGRIVRGLDVQCGNDADAMAQAAALPDAPKIEVWQRGRLVGVTSPRGDAPG